MSYTSLSPSTIQLRTLSHYYLLLISPSSKAPSVTSSNTSQDKSAVLLPTRSTKTRGPKRVASVASNTADLRCIFFQCPHVRRRQSSMLLFSTEEMCRNGCGKVGLSPKLFKTVDDLNNNLWFKKKVMINSKHAQNNRCSRFTCFLPPPNIVFLILLILRPKSF